MPGGGFCGPRVVAIIARELGIPVEKVTKKGGKSRIVMGPSKEPLLECSCSVEGTEKEVGDDV